MSYKPIANSLLGDNFKSPRVIKQENAPPNFITADLTALLVAAVKLNGKPISPYGEMVVNLTLLSPSLYPIAFAAVASRFFKNVARYRLEKRRGIELAMLEQIFGSQNLAGAVERLLFVRTKLLVGILIVLVWAMSPLGGQSAARILRKSATNETGIVYYTHNAYQDVEDFFNSSDSSAVSLYRTSLSLGQKQERKMLDAWDWSKIPRWPKGVETMDKRVIDPTSLVSGEESYASLIGIEIQGLGNISVEAQYAFTIETSYYDFDCTLQEVGVSMNQSKINFPDSWGNLSYVFGSGSFEVTQTFAAFVWSPDPTAMYEEDIELPTGFLAFSVFNWWPEENDYDNMLLDNYNCTMRPVILEADILSPHSPEGYRQRETATG
ncbi:hypothetical protein IL306_006349 [Fusarium sp. DS 682]|nr:hypothetical protein IL306_006349 [Fusarium sp. DS 682]